MCPAPPGFVLVARGRRTASTLPRIGRRFLILHGWQGSSGPHWQRWLAAQLRDAGHEVQLPELPDPMTPVLSDWLAALDAELGAAAADDDLTVVCHSLGCILWLHHAAAPQRPAVRARRVLLNAPPAPLGELPTFFPVPLDPGAVMAAAGTTRLVCSDEDPYCPGGAVAAYAEPLGLPYDLLPGQGHLNVDAGYGPWPAMLDWCLERRTELVPR